MKKILNRHTLLTMCLGTVLAAELFFLLDFIVVYFGGMLPLYTPVFFVFAAVVVILLCFRSRWKPVLALALTVPAVVCAAVGLGYAGWRSFAANAVYENPDSGKHQLYGDRDVMVIVPHQDDELNILGGVLEEYVRYGSGVRVVFVTNGDFVFSAETRMTEALAVCDAIGIPGDRVVFLGYGNEWEKGMPHIYNSDPDTVCTSYAGMTAVYGTGVHPAYREGSAYTLGNLERDLKDVILENRPDTIFCSDFDHHIDHKATSMLFERVMGKILKEHPDYTPVVYKGYAYGTAWESEPDYYADNVLSTKNLYEAPYSQRPVTYRWEDRVRMPVAGDTLSRSLMGAPAYRTLALHNSQGAAGFADRVLSGDRVFWRRQTTSLVLQAAVTASSGDAERLQDFMLVDHGDITDLNRLPYDGAWVPEQTDTSRTAEIMLKEDSGLAAIVLYDHPSPEDNVLNAVITFDDGSSLETGPLNPDGAATYIPVDKARVSGFSVSLPETEGDMAGLSEIEAFEVLPETDGRFIKLMDAEGNFAYDYRTEPDGYAEFMLYTHGDLPEVTPEHYSVETAWDAEPVELDGGVIRLHCPRGESVVLNVTCADAGVSDSIVVRNPGALESGWSGFWLRVEEAVYSGLVRSDSTLVSRLNVSRIWERISYIIRHI